MITFGKKPNSTIEKWLHFDNKYSSQEVSTLLGVDERWYMDALKSPAKNFTVDHIERLSLLLKRDRIEVFFAIWKPRYQDIAHDPDLVRYVAALEKNNIK